MINQRSEIEIGRLDQIRRINNKCRIISTRNNFKLDHFKDQLRINWNANNNDSNRIFSGSTGWKVSETGAFQGSSGGVIVCLLTLSRSRYFLLPITNVFLIGLIVGIYVIQKKTVRALNSNFILETRINFWHKQA